MSVNRSKGARVGLRELRFVYRLHEATPGTAGALARAEVFRYLWPYGTGKRGPSDHPG